MQLQSLPKDVVGPDRCPLWLILPTRFHGVQADSAIDVLRARMREEALEGLRHQCPG